MVSITVRKITSYKLYEKNIPATLSDAEGTQWKYDCLLATRTVGRRLALAPLYEWMGVARVTIMRLPSLWSLIGAGVLYAKDGLE